MAQGKSQSAKTAAVEARRLARVARKAADRASAKAKVAADAAVAATQAAEEAAAAARNAAAITSPGARDAETEQWWSLTYCDKNNRWEVKVGNTTHTLDDLKNGNKNVRITLKLGSRSDDQDQAMLLQQQQQLMDYVSKHFATLLSQEGTCDNQN